MIENDREPVNRTTPKYSLLSTDAFTALSVAAGLVILNIALMFAAGFTPVADILPFLYSLPFGQFVLVIVFGIGLTAARYAGIYGVQQENTALATAGVVGSLTVFTIFGAGVLGLFNADIWVPALAITGGIVTIITVVVAAIVFNTDHSFKNWSMYSGFLFMGGIGAIFLASFIPAFSLIGFGLILLGFIVDLFFELWSITGRDISPIANGIGVYVAVMGIYVQVLQLVLRALAEQ